MDNGRLLKYIIATLENYRGTNVVGKMKFKKMFNIINVKSPCTIGEIMQGIIAQESQKKNRREQERECKVRFSIIKQNLGSIFYSDHISQSPKS
jgi:hypothetical protein